MKTFKRSCVLAVSLSAMLCVTACDVQYKNGGGLTQTQPENPRYKVVTIEGGKYIAFQTAYGYWNYSPVAESCGK